MAQLCPEVPTSPSSPIPRLRHELRGLPRQFWLLTAGTLVYLIGVEMCYPFETLYMATRLHVSSTDIGLILGLTLFATLPMEVVGGALCDRWGRRPVLIVAICGSTALYLGLGLTQTLWIIVLLFTQEAAFGWANYITASNAMVADLSPPERRADAFSISRTALNTGITIGPLLALPLIAHDPSYRTSFLVGGAVCALFLVMVVTLFRETRPPGLQAASVRAAFRGYAEVLRDRRMLLFCLVALLPLFAFGQIWVTLPIMLRDLQHVSAQSWSVTLAVYGAATAVLQYPVVRLLRGRDHLALMATSSLCMGGGLAACAFVPWPATLACVLVVSVGVVVLIPIAATVVSALAPPPLRGRYMGAWTLVYMGGYALGPLLGGWLLDALGGRGAFAVTGVTGLAGAALFLALRRAVALGPRPGVAPADLDEVLAGELPPDQLM